MSKFRVVMVWCVAVSAILIVYRLYNRFSNTPQIQPPNKKITADVPIPEFDPDGPEIAQGTAVGEVKQSVFTFVNEETKKLERVFGFEKLLNPDTNTKSRRWPLLKPYMNMYEDDFTCKITSDKGTVQVDTVNNNPNPTEAELYDNVVIHIKSTDPAQPSDSWIYVDTLTYNSERSEFFTEGPMRLVSDDAEMEGVGMVLIYNVGLNRIEFLKIRDLHYIRLKNVADMSVDKDNAVAEEKATSEAAVANTPANAATADNRAEPAADKADPAAKPLPTHTRDDLYQCTLNEEVFIQYGDRMIVEGTERITVSNILLARKDSKPKSEEADEPDAASATGTNDIAAAESKPETSAEEVGPVTEVYITCQGGIVAKPMTSVYDQTEPQRVGAQNLELYIALPPEDDSVAPVVRTASLAASSAGDDSTAEIVGNPNLPIPFAGDNAVQPDRFKARFIEYDMTSGDGLAQGPVEVAFTPDPNDMNDPNCIIMPMIVRAEKNAEFLANDGRVIERIVLNRNVIGSRKTITPDFVQVGSFHGDKLTIELQPDAEGNAGRDIKQVSVTDGNVKLESVRTSGDVKLSHVKLSCRRIDFDAIKEIVYAVGPGDIEMNNKNIPEPEKSDKRGSLSFNRPAFGLVRGFDRLTWFTQAMQINADGRKDSLYLGYWPIIDGKRGRIVRGATTHLQANFIRLPDGTDELATVITAGGIFYEEEGGNVFVGEGLLYDAAESLLTVTSTENNSCLLNGALVDRIEYEVDTGNVRSQLASSPGAVSTPISKD